MGWIQPAIGLGLGITGLFGGRKSQEQKQQEQNSLTAQREGLGWARQGAEEISPALSYWQKILGGSRQSALEHLAPEVQGATQRMEAGKQSLMTLAPRSGGAATQVDPYAKAAAATNILQGARREAATGLTQAGGTLAGIGQGLYGTGASQGASLLEQERLRKKALMDQAGAIGKSLFDFMGSFGKNKKGAQ